MAFPTEIEGEVTLSGADRPLAAWLDLVAAAVAHEGATVTERGPDRVGFRGAAFLPAIAFRASELFLTDDGLVTIVAETAGTRLRYTLSTRRALTFSSIAAAAIAALMFPVAGPVWSVFGGLVVWGWGFGWNWFTQGLRAATLFEEMDTARD
jgi:hypothetical protein